MLIENETGAFQSKQVAWPGGPGIFHSTSVTGDQVVTLEKLGGNGVTWVPLGDIAMLTGNGMVNFNLEKGAILRADRASGTAVFADVETRIKSM